MGASHLKRKQWEDALASYTTCIEVDPNEPRGWLKCGEAMLQLKRHEDTERYLRKALELNPLMTDAIVEYGYLELDRGDIESAEECFERVLSIEPGHKKALAGSKSIRRTVEGNKK
jgi:tetratricopeptide (TPR) repeat protein